MHGTRRLEESAASRDHLFWPVVDAETHSPVDDVPKNRTRMTVIASNARRRRQLD
jgi:hypothetical protein